MRGRLPISDYWMLLPAILLLVAFFLVPTLDIVKSSVFDPELTGRHFSRALFVDVYVKVLWWTISVSLAVALLCALIGYPAAYFVVQRPRHQQFLLIFLILIPLWMSVLIRSYAWMVLLGREGIVNSSLILVGLTDTPLKLLYTTGAVVVALVQILLPVQIVTAYSSMVDIDLSLLRAARILGAKQWQAVLRIFVPLSLDGVFSGAIIVFMISMGSFITPALVGSRKDIMLGNLIEFQVTQLNWGFAAALGVILLVSSLGGVIVLRWIGGRLSWLFGGGGLA